MQFPICTCLTGILVSLLLSVLSQVALLASKVGLVALRALHSTTAALDLYEQVISPITSKQEGVGPPPPDTPQLLPSVHAIWGPLVGALRVSLPRRNSMFAPYKTTFVCKQAKIVMVLLSFSEVY